MAFGVTVGQNWVASPGDLWLQLNNPCGKQPFPGSVSPGASRRSRPAVWSMWALSWARWWPPGSTARPSPATCPAVRSPGPSRPARNGASTWRARYGHPGLGGIFKDPGLVRVVDPGVFPFSFSLQILSNGLDSTLALLGLLEFCVAVAVLAFGYDTFRQHTYTQLVREAGILGSPRNAHPHPFLPSKGRSNPSVPE